ncbi:MAG: N-acetyltransferase [Mesorhizobium sp.]
MGVFEDGKPIAVMVFHDWHPENGVVEISGAATDRRWLNRKTLWEMFSYPFEQLGAQLVVMRVSERNVMWNGRGLPRLLKAYGFQCTTIPRLRGRDEAEAIWTLSDDDWRANGFHEVRHGQERAEAD